MVKNHYDWNSHIEEWESDGRVFKTPPQIPINALMEVSGLHFLHFGNGGDRAELRGTVSAVDDMGIRTPIYTSDRFQTFRPSRFDALSGGDFSQGGGGRPIDGEYNICIHTDQYNICIHTDLEDKTHGKLLLTDPSLYEAIPFLGGDDFLKEESQSSLNKVPVWAPLPARCATYGSLYRRQLIGPHCAFNVLFAVYQDAVAATVQLTFMKSETDFGPDSDVRADVCGKITARNTVVTDPEAYSTLFTRTHHDYASLQLGYCIPLSKPSVVVPDTSSLLLDLDLEFRVPNSSARNHKFLETKSFFQVPASQAFQRFVDITSPDADGAFAMLKVEVKWSIFKF